VVLNKSVLGAAWENGGGSYSYHGPISIGSWIRGGLLITGPSIPSANVLFSFLKNRPLFFFFEEKNVLFSESGSKQWMDEVRASPLTSPTRLLTPFFSSEQ
jgi:hypothetical protein